MSDSQEIQDHVDALHSLNDTTEFQKRCMSQISFAVNLSDTCLEKHFSHTVNTAENAGQQYATIRLENKTGNTFHQDFWRVIFDIHLPNGDNRTTYNCWSLSKPWKQGETLDFRLRINPLHCGAQTISCSLSFSVPSSYVDGADEPPSRSSDRSAVLALPLFSATLDALHALEPPSAVSAAPAPAPCSTPALLPPAPAAEPVSAPPLELGVAVSPRTPAADWLATALRDGHCLPADSGELAAAGRLWGCPVRLAASEPAGVSLLTVSCARLAPLLRLLRALRRRLPAPPPADAVRVPSHVLTRLHGLLERVQDWSGDPSRLLELWLAAHQTVSYRLPHV